MDRNLRSLYVHPNAHAATQFTAKRIYLVVDGKYWGSMPRALRGGCMPSQALTQLFSRLVIRPSAITIQTYRCVYVVTDESQLLLHRFIPVSARRE